MNYFKIQQVKNLMTMKLKTGGCFFCKHANYSGGFLKTKFFI